MPGFVTPLSGMDRKRQIIGMLFSHLVRHKFGRVHIIAVFEQEVALDRPGHHRRL